MDMDSPLTCSKCPDDRIVKLKIAIGAVIAVVIILIIRLAFNKLNDDGNKRLAPILKIGANHF